MANLMKIGSDVLAAAAESYLSGQVKFEKVDTRERATILATIGRNSADANDNLGLRSEFEGQEFIVRLSTPATLVPADETEITFQEWLDRDPRQNDRIHWNDKIWIVCSPLGKDPWRYTDGFQTSYRFHTKQMGAT